MDQKKQETLQTFCRLIGLLFYEDRYVLIIDLLLKYRVLREDVIAEHIKLGSKDVNKLLSKLKGDMMIKTEMKLDTRDNEPGRYVSRCYYYIDYIQFVNMVKFKIYKLRQLIENTMSDQAESLGYECKECETEYSLLDVPTLLDPETGELACTYCQGPLTENKPTIVQGSESMTMKFMVQITPVINLLKKIDKMEIPQFQLETWLEPTINTAALSTVERPSITEAQKLKLDVIIERSNLSIPNNPEYFTINKLFNGFYSNLITDAKLKKDDKKKCGLNMDELEKMDPKTYAEYYQKHITSG